MDTPGTRSPGVRCDEPDADSHRPKPRTADKVSWTRVTTGTSVLLAGGLVLAGCTSQPEAAGPAEVLEQYEEARDASDIDALMALYAEGAVVTGHPLEEGSPPIATGAEEIRLLEEQISDLQRAEDANDFFDTEVTGNTAVFSNQFFTDDGSCYSGSGHEITVEDGQITSYAWGTHSQPCE